MVLKKKSVALN